MAACGHPCPAYGARGPYPPGRVAAPVSRGDERHTSRALRPGGVRPGRPRREAEGNGPPARSLRPSVQPSIASRPKGPWFPPFLDRSALVELV